MVGLDTDSTLFDEPADRAVDRTIERFYEPWERKSSVVGCRSATAIRSVFGVDAVSTDRPERAVSATTGRGSARKAAAARRAHRRASRGVSLLARRGAARRRNRRSRRTSDLVTATYDATVSSLSSERRPLPLELRRRSRDARSRVAAREARGVPCPGEEGLTALELDIKDENGQVGFTPASVPMAREVEAAREYYAPRHAAPPRAPDAACISSAGS